MATRAEVWRRWQVLTVAAVVTGGAAMLWRFDPSLSAFFPRCIFHLLTGLHCPGCGTTRALHALLHGRLLDALHYNSLTVLALPFVFYSFTRTAMRVLAGLRLPSPYVPARWIWGLLVVVVLFTVLRNLQVMPFTLLAPGG